MLRQPLDPRPMAGWARGEATSADPSARESNECSYFVPAKSRAPRVVSLRSCALAGQPPNQGCLRRATRRVARKISPGSLTDLATIGGDKMRVMVTMIVIFIVALIAVAGEICSQAARNERPGLPARRRMRLP
jgi:hypothetical protein